MAVALSWTEPALSDLDAIAEVIAIENPDAAARFVQRVLERVELLRDHPQAGPRIPELEAHPRYRQLVEPPCRIFYRFSRGERRVWILAVLRTERLFVPAKLAQREATTRRRR